MENFIFRAVRAVILTKNQQVLNLLPQVSRSYDVITLLPEDRSNVYTWNSKFSNCLVATPCP